MKKINYLLYVAHGNINFKNEAIFSVLSYVNKREAEDDISVLIYTDDASYFKSVLGELSYIIYEEVNEYQWQSWRGEINFIHRVKPEVVRHAIEKYKSCILFLDSDTYFLQNPQNLFHDLSSGKRFLHVFENSLITGAAIHNEMYDFLKRNPLPIWSDISSETAMYNSGAIGLCYSDLPLLDQVISLIDELHNVYPTHLTEQFAFSKILAQQGPIDEVAPYVLHYWHMKDIRPVLVDFFAQHAGKPLPILLEKLRQLPIVEASKQKDVWESHYRWQRALLRIIGQGWKWPTS